MHVARLRRSSSSHAHEHRAGRIAGLEVTGSRVPETSEVSVDVVLQAVAGGVEVTGSVEAPWEGACRRCLTRATGTLVVPVRELYTQSGDGNETYELHDDTVDLEILAHDALLLELPPAPLCRPDCQGLCPMCGVDRNLEDCLCEAPADPRFGALDVLRTAETEAGHS